jgi:hypothetical protein
VSSDVLLPVILPFVDGVSVTVENSKQVTGIHQLGVAEKVFLITPLIRLIMAVECETVVSAINLLFTTVRDHLSEMSFDCLSLQES